MTWQKARVWLLGTFILIFVVGVFILMNTGKKIAPMQMETPSANGEDFGQYLIDHYDLLAPFFERNRQNLLTQGEPLLLKVMGDVILLNMGIGWIIATGMAFGFASIFVRAHNKPQDAAIYATYRLCLDIGVFLMGSIGGLGWEQLNLPIPVVFFFIIFVIIDIIVQSILVSNVYGTSSALSTGFYIVLMMVIVAVGALVSTGLIKKRLAILMAQFVDVQSVTAELKAATDEGNRQLAVASAGRDDAKDAVAAAQGKLDQIHDHEKALRKDIEDKQNTEAYVYGRIIRIQTQGDLATARDLMNAFLVKFPSGTLAPAAKAQLDLINQEIAAQEALKNQSATDAARAAAQARADLLAKAANGEASLVEMRHALLGKTPAEVRDLFGQPTAIDSNRWGYSSPMLWNPQTNAKRGLSVYFNDGYVQSVDYYYASGEAK